jgi:phosphoheptose isomerase
MTKLKTWLDFKQDYCADLVQNIRDATWDLKLEEIARLMNEARTYGGTIFVCGNGGSAAIANHVAIDLNKVANSSPARGPFRCVSLTANPSELTAWANDDEYASVFSNQLAVLADKGDLVFLISASGTSPNIVEAGRWCQENGVASVLFTSDMKPADNRACSDVQLTVESSHYGRIEDTHMYVLHLLCYAFKEGLLWNR